MKLCISSFSLRSEFGTDGIDIYEFIRMAKEDFGVDAIEIWPLHIDPPEPAPKQSVFNRVEWDNFTPEEVAEIIKNFNQLMRNKRAIKHFRKKHGKQNGKIRNN